MKKLRINKYILLLAGLLLLQTVLFILAGVQKSYIHMDEAYSLGLSSYDKTEIQHNEDFYDQWHGKEYYEDYLSLQPDEKDSFYPVYENQKNDVHPPLYYLFLRIGMEFDGGHFNKWPGIVINIILYFFITILMYLICKRITKEQAHGTLKAILLAFFSSITLAALTSAIYIRMYTMATFFVVLTAFLHMRLYESNRLRDILFIGLAALLGSLTHYYYIFFIAASFVLFVVHYIKEKKYKTLFLYFAVLSLAAALSLCIFPHSIDHMFFGYRGQGFISKLLDFSGALVSFATYLSVILQFVFNDIIVWVLLAFWIIRGCRKDKMSVGQQGSPYLRILYVPTIAYTIIVAIASPWQDIRYIMPVSGFLFVIVLYQLYVWLRSGFSEKKCNMVFAIILAAMLISPSVFKTEPGVAYTDKKDIVSKVENEMNVPTIYMFNSSHNRFLDDILLFSKLDASYIAKDMDCTEENIKAIFENKDTSRGIVVFINPGQENDELLAVIKSALSLENAEYVERLNACDVYFVK